jgi:hypothetical protein
MQQVRTRLATWAGLALALFVWSIATPRAGLYFHLHAGGDHRHVHVDGEDHDHAGGDPHHHDHHAHLADDSANQPAIEAPDDDGTGHWHSRDFFQRAVTPAVVAARHAEAVEVVRARPERARVDRPALPTRARGPPRTA